MQIGVARQLSEENAKDGRIESVLIRVHLREQLENRMRVFDDLEVVAILGGLRERVSARQLLEIASEVRFRATRCLARVPQLCARASIPNVKPKRLRCDGDGVQIRRRVDPRSVGCDGASIVEWRSLRWFAAKNRHRRREVFLRRERGLDPCE